MKILALFLLLSVSAFAQRTDFSGNWTLKPDRVKALKGELYPNAFPKSIKVRQDSTVLLMETVNGTDIGEITAQETLQLDQPNESKRADKRRQVTVCGWDAGEKVLIIARTLYAASDKKKPEMKFTEVWAILPENNRNVLVLLRKAEDLTGGPGGYAYSAVYEKQ